MIAWLAGLALLGSPGEGDLPPVLRAQEAEAVEPLPASPSTWPFLCLDEPEFSLRGGMVVYSSDFESDPQASASLLVRLAMPWLSREVLGFCERHVGIFVELTATKLDRELEPALPDSSGSVWFATLGLDVEILRSREVSLLAQGGIQVARFGSVDETEDGLGGLAGLRAEIRLLGGWWATASPQAAFGDGDERVYFIHLGLQYRF